MSEYNIQVKIDPQTSAGASKVASDLKQIDAAAAATTEAVAAIGTGALAGSKSLTSAQSDMMRSMTAVKKSTDDLAQGNEKLNAATLRVLQATDREAANLAKLNQVVSDAKKGFDAGTISQEQYATAQKLAADAALGHNTNIAQQRQGVLILGEQFRQFATEVQLGISPVQALAQQSGQAAFGMQFLGGKVGEVGKFLASGWGTLVLVGVTVLASLAGAAYEASDKIGKMVDKMKEDEKEAELAKRANVIFSQSIEGITKAKREADEANTKWTLMLHGDAYAAVDGAEKNLKYAKSLREITRAKLADAIANYDATKERAQAGTQRGENAAIGAPMALDTVTQLQDKLRAQDEEIAKYDQALNQTRIDYADTIAKATDTKLAQIKESYEGPHGVIAKEKERLNGLRLSTAEYERQLGLVRTREQVELEAERKREADAKKKPPSDGVSRFKSREEAIGVAGRELQGFGLRVGENNQFGGVSPVHKNNAAHALYDVDVNAGKGITEADVPDLRAWFDALARSYQARGYKVLWNGNVYAPGGNGPTGRITGADKHRDHMHLEAPQTIVGQPTDEGVTREAENEYKTAKGDRDFIDRILDSNNAQGRGKDAAATLQTKIAKARADFARERERPLTKGEDKELVDSFTEADARVIAERFKTAYLDPLEKLQALSGKTGLDRDIAAAWFEEADKRGVKVEELSTLDKAAIAISLNKQDALKREAALLGEVNGPIEEYRRQVEALNDALLKGEIDQAQYNTRLDDLKKPGNSFLAGLQGPSNDPQQFAREAARKDADIQRNSDLAAIDTFERQKLDIGITYTSAREAVERRHAATMKAIDQARGTQALQTASDLFGKTAAIAEQRLGKESAVYKAFAITQATIDAYMAINAALADHSLPTPVRIATAIGIGATALVNVATIAGLKDGGPVEGEGGPRDDKVLRYLSNGEYVINADATAANRPLLDAINSGRVASKTRSVANDNGRAVVGGGDTYHLSFGDVNVSGTNDSNGKAIGADVKAALRGLVDERIADAKRSGGALTKTSTSVMTG